MGSDTGIGSVFRQQYLQHIRGMYNPDYKVGLQKTLELERSRNDELKRKLSAMRSEVDSLSVDGLGREPTMLMPHSPPWSSTYTCYC